MRLRAMALVVVGCLLAGCGSFMEEPDSPEYLAASRPFRDLVQKTNARMRVGTIGNYPVPTLHWREVEAVAMVLAMSEEYDESEEMAGQFLAAYSGLEQYQEHGLKRVYELLDKPGWFYEEHPTTVTRCYEEAGALVCEDEHELWFSQNSLSTVMNKLGFDEDEKQLTRDLLWDGCRGEWTPRLSPLGWTWPLAPDNAYPMIHAFPIASPFGLRSNPVTGDQRDIQMHNGIDIAVPTCTPVYAAHAGKVVLVNRMGDTGCGVEVKIEMVNPPDMEAYSSVGTRYCHLTEAAVDVGVEVVAGQPIALSGNTGTFTTGAHLHFEVHINGVPVDPFPYFG